MTIERISALVAAESFAEALEQCDDELRRGVESAYFDAYRATALEALGRHDEAIEALSRASSLRPQDAGLACCLGELLVHAYGDYDRAEPLFFRAIALNPTDKGSYLGLAECHLQRSSFHDAWSRSGEVLPTGANTALFLEAMVVQLCNKGRYSEGHSAASQLGETRDASPAADLALARIAEEAEHDFTLARKHLDIALRAFPGHTPCHLAYLAHVVKIGAWNEASLRARAMMKYFGYTYPRFGDARNWDGSLLVGKTILLDSRLAKGYGDSIHFCRFAAWFKERGGAVGIRARRGLESLLASAAGVDFVLARSEPGRGVDYVCEMSLAWLLLRIPKAEVSTGVPYLHASRQAVAKWSAALGPSTRFQVGLAWHSADKRTANPYTAKNIPIASLAPLAELDGIRLISLHVFPAQDRLVQVFGADSVTEFGPQLADFMQTAALVSQMQAVVTVDTAVAHLAGALGKPTFLLLPFSAEWRWLLRCSDTPWYATMRLIRQPRPGDWAPVIQECAQALRDLARSAQRSS